MAAELVDVLRRIWRLLDPRNVAGTQQAWVDAVVEVVGPYRARSVQLAVGYLTALRAREVGPDPRFRPTPAGPVDLDALRTSLYATGATPVRKAVRRLDAMALDDAVRERRLTQARDEAFVTSTASVQRHVVNGGRETAVATTEVDSRALGWIRVSDGDPCSFCAMLISRGPVYKGDSFVQSNGKFKDVPASDPRYLARGQYKAHDFDGCILKPVYSNDDPAVLAAERLSDLWASSTRGASGKGALKAFKTAYAAR